MKVSFIVFLRVTISELKANALLKDQCVQAWFEPGTSGLAVRHVYHSATHPQNWVLGQHEIVLIMSATLVAILNSFCAHEVQRYKKCENVSAAPEHEKRPKAWHQIRQVPKVPDHEVAGSR